MRYWRKKEANFLNKNFNNNFELKETFFLENEEVTERRVENYIIDNSILTLRVLAKKDSRTYKFFKEFHFLIKLNLALFV